MKRKNTLNGKKGNAILDTIFIIIIILFFGLIALFVYKILGDVNIQIQNSDLSTDSKERFQSITTNYPSYMDNLFFLAFILLWITAVILSFFIDAHPVFFVINIILIMIVLFITGILSNAYSDISDVGGQGDLSPEVFPKMNYILTHLVMFILFMTFSIAIALYGKSVMGNA